MGRIPRTVAILAVFTAGMLAAACSKDRKGEQPPAKEAPAEATGGVAGGGAQEPPAEEPATPVQPETEPAPDEVKAEPEPEGKAEPEAKAPEAKAEPEASAEPEAKAPSKPSRSPGQPKPIEPPEPAVDEPGDADRSEPAADRGALPGQGEPCKSGRCAKGLSCVEYYGIAGPRGPAMSSCEIRCVGGKGCPAGQHCTTISDGPGPVCRPH